MRRLPKDVWVLIVLLLLLIVAGMIAGNRQGEDSEFEYFPRRTTYSSRPGGTKALYETLDSLGYPVTRRLDELGPDLDDGTLFIISPESKISRDEWDSLRAWVKRGNLLILAGDQVEPPEFGHRAHISSARAACPSFLSPGVHSVRIAGLNRIDQTDMALDGRGSLGKPFGLGSNEEAPSGSAAEKRPMIPLFADHTGTVVAYSSWGKGEVILLPDGWPLSNRGVGVGDNLALVLNALDHRDSSHQLKVTFDELHHGYGERKGIMSLIDTPARLGLAVIALAFLLLVFSTSRRFGKPIPLSEAARERGEYLSSLASLLRNAKATDLVRSELGKRFLADMAVAVGVNPGAGVDAIVARAEERYPEKSAQLRELCVAAASTDQDSSEASIFTLARRWHKMREELKR